MYIVDTKQPARLAADHPILYRFLLNKWYFDELYDAIFVRPAMASAGSCGDGRRPDHRRARA